MKIQFFLLALFVFAVSISAQVILEEPNAKSGNHIKTTYDTESDVTVMETLPYLLDEPIGGCPDFLSIRGAFVHKGKDLAGGRYYLTFVCRGSEWTFDPRSELTLTVDGETLSMGTGDRNTDGGSDALGQSTYETMSFGLAMDELNTIAKAKKVELQVGTVTSPLPSVAIAGIRQLIAGSVPNRKK